MFEAGKITCIGAGVCKGSDEFLKTMEDGKSALNMDKSNISDNL